MSVSIFSVDVSISVDASVYAYKRTHRILPQMQTLEDMQLQKSVATEEEERKKQQILNLLSNGVLLSTYYTRRNTHRLHAAAHARKLKLAKLHLKHTPQRTHRLLPWSLKLQHQLPHQLQKVQRKKQPPMQEKRSKVILQCRHLHRL